MSKTIEGLVEHKILFTGSMGAGKTTAIGTVSEVATATTEALNSDYVVEKEKTTVAYDYGEVWVGENKRLRLYGTPGQERFSFMWKVLVQGSTGIVILIDYSDADPLGQLTFYLEQFADILEKVPCVVGISKLDASKHACIEDVVAVTQDNGVHCPVIAVDVRNKEQVMKLLNLLLLQMESNP